MIDHGTASLTDAWKGGRALASFTTYTLESTVAICRAGEQAGAAVMLQAASGCFQDVGVEELAACMLAAARTAATPVGVHLDHATDLELVDRCLRLGFTSVMIDGSALPFDDNLELTRQAVALAHGAGAWIEGELGGVGGAEDRSGGSAGQAAATDPQAAAQFVADTGVDALAVAVGNVHGMSADPVVLDLDLLARIRQNVPVPLVLHGTSGLPSDVVAATMQRGVAKFNINTELRRAHLQALQEPVEGDDLRPVRRRAIDVMRDVAVDHVRRLMGPPPPDGAMP